MVKKNKNFKVNKSFLNFIHARDFFPQEEVEETRSWLAGHRYSHWTPNGFEIPNFNLVFPDMELIVGGMLGDWVKIEDEGSGTFRIPFDNQVMFESFDSLNEWRMAVAMDDNIFRTYNHISGAKDAKEGYEFDYTKPEDWVVETTINIKSNDAIFYRPWVFHSFEAKLIHHHKIYVEED